MKLNLLTKAVSIILAASTTMLLAAEGEESVSEEESKERKIVIVTGTSKGRLAADTPQSVSLINEEELSKFTFSSQADVLRYIPGIKAEGGGGEVATNLQVRGLPSAGQFQFTPLLFDGSPVFSTFGLNSSAFDVYFRNDLGIERLEFVRGGVSNLFGPGSVAGVINYISKKGGDIPESTVQIEIAEEGRIRNDFATSGPLSDKGLYYALSGFYRYDEGPIDTGLPTEGFQIRGNIHKDFEDGSGSFTLHTQIIDDSVQFFLPFPLDASSRERTPGNDGSDVDSVQTVFADGLSYPTANGTYESPIGDGVTTQGASIALEFEKELSDDISISANAKYSSYEHEFNLFLDGDGIVNVPETLSGYLQARNLGDINNANFTFADSGQAVPTNDLLFANRLLDRNRPADDFSSEFNVTKSFEAGSFSHDLTIGTFFSRTEADDENVVSTYLAEFNNQPRLVNLTVNDVDGSISGVPGTEVTVSRNGVVGPGVGFNNKTLSARKTALYIADQFENDKWIFDIGARWERIEGKIKQEGSELVTISDDPSLAPNLQVNRTGNGNFLHAEVATSDVAVSAAALYRYSDNMNIYGNLSRGYFFPEIRSVRFDSFNRPASYEAEIIEQGEFGIKFFTDTFSGSAALFFANLSDRNNVDFVNDGQGGVEEVTITQSTEATGIELVGSWRVSDNITIDGNLTYQDHEFKKFEADPTVIGNELRRKPNLLINTGIRYDDGTYDVSLFHNFHGDNFANDSNTVELDSFNLLRLEAGYTWNFGKSETIRTSLSVFNLSDSQGITEGSPRQGNSQTAGSEFFVGRPILPRRITLRVRYDF